MRSPVQRGSGPGAGGDSQNHWYADFYLQLTFFNYRYRISPDSIENEKLKTINRINFESFIEIFCT